MPIGIGSWWGAAWRGRCDDVVVGDGGSVLGESYGYNWRLEGFRASYVRGGEGGGRLLYFVVIFDVSSECTVEVWTADAVR
jgi:hypothetical protein